MNLPPIIKQLDKTLQGEPDSVLTFILIVIGLFSIAVAIKGKPVFKAALAAWFIAP